MKVLKILEEKYWWKIFSGKIKFVNILLDIWLNFSWNKEDFGGFRNQIYNLNTRLIYQKKLSSKYLWCISFLLFLIIGLKINNGHNLAFTLKKFLKYFFHYILPWQNFSERKFWLWFSTEIHSHRNFPHLTLGIPRGGACHPTFYTCDDYNYGILMPWFEFS